MDDLSLSEGSTTSTDYSISTNDKHLKIKQEDDSIIKVNRNPTCSKGATTKRRPVGHLSRKQDKESEAQLLEFEDTHAVRDAVYQQWLLEKKAKIKEKRIMETKEKTLLQDEVAKAIAKKEQLKVDAMKAYEKWKMKKDEVMVKKIKAKKQEKGKAITL